MMVYWPAVTVLLLGSPASVRPDYINVCDSPPKVPTLYAIALLANEHVTSQPNPHRSLVYQMFRNPCIEVEYMIEQGSFYIESPLYTIYGTCNHTQMFRYKAQKLNYGCWATSLSVWEQSATDANCREVEAVEKSYSGNFFDGEHGYSTVMQINHLNGSRNAAIILHSAATFNIASIDTAKGQLQKSVKGYTGDFLEPVKCDCNRTRRQRQSAFWRTNCYHSRYQLRGNVGFWMVFASIGTLLLGVAVYC